jgi:hypothetical protein
MKKSLILASLLLVGTSSIASDYIDLKYGVGAVEYDNSNGIIDIDAYSASLKRNTENYILYVGIVKGTAKSQKWIIDDSCQVSPRCTGVYYPKKIKQLFVKFNSQKSKIKQ